VGHIGLGNDELTVFAEDDKLSIYIDKRAMSHTSGSPFFLMRIYPKATENVFVESKNMIVDNNRIGIMVLEEPALPECRWAACIRRSRQFQQRRSLAISRRNQDSIRWNENRRCDVSVVAGNPFIIPVGCTIRRIDTI